MTFEEFFVKKKIDLVLFEKAEPNLFNEFRSHFSLMGEKSFDHTKKFWFNKLRRLYHLPSPEKTIPAAKPAIVTQAEPLSSPTIEQKPAFKPRFKSAIMAKAEPSEVKQEAAPISKPAFKPRNIPVKAPEESQTEISAINDTPSVSKPAFRPRNIPTKTADPIPEESTSSSIESPKKPGFKPRNIKPATEDNTVDETKPESQPEQKAISEIPAIDKEKPEESPKQGYKPKFKLKSISQKPAASQEQTAQLTEKESSPNIASQDIELRVERNTEDKTPEQEIQDNDLNKRENGHISQEAPKPVYKAKFNLKNIKPKPEE